MVTFVVPIPDAVLSLLDKPLKILGKVNGILKERRCDEEGTCGDTERLVEATLINNILRC